MSQVDFNTTITALDGVTAVRNEHNKVVKFRDIAIASLLANRPCTPEDKIADFNLAERLHRNQAGEVDLGIKEVAHLKKRIAECQGPLVVKRCWDIFDPRTEEE